MPRDASTPVHTTGELEEQLRRRLRVTSTIWACATGVLALTALVVRFERVRADAGSMWTEPPLPGVLLVISAMTLGVVWWLAPGTALGLKRLRAIEWFGVATAAFFFALNQTRALGNMLPDLLGNPMEVGVAQGAPWGALIVGYGVLIPASLRHSAARTAAIAACAFLPELILIPGLTAPVPGLTAYLSLKTIMITVMSALALYGSYRIEELAQDVESARQLGQYILRRVLGEGGMGTVYLADHRFLRRPCAVKLIRPDQARDGATMARFEREVQAAAGLTHPNTVQIYDYGQSEDGTFYFAMEYLPGITLDDLVARHGPLDPARAVRILAQLCGALREAHDRGLIHRDLKPGNVMLCERGSVPDMAKLLDFGLVGALQHDGTDTRITQAGVILGTPSYMSPEQCMGEVDITPASDIYSLGALGYFLLTGASPFDGRPVLQMIVAHLHETPRPVVELRPDVPQQLSDVIDKCLAKRPDERFLSAAALEHALVHSLGSATWSESDARDWWKAQVAGS